MPCPNNNNFDCNVIEPNLNTWIEVPAGFYRAKAVTGMPEQTWETKDLILAYALGQMTGRNVLLDKNPVQVDGLTIKVPAN